MSNVPSTRRNAGIIRGLSYFEAVARHQSVKLAAEELGVSQSAVSHQLRELTRVLGEQLLVRSGRGISLSPVGQQLAERLAVSFSGLQASVDDIIGHGKQTLRLAVCSSFGPGWLIPRLAGFFAAHPEVDLQLHLYAQDPLITNQVADAIVSALPVQPGYAAVRVIEEMLVAVHAPGFSTGRHRLITTDIESMRLGQDWIDHCAHTGLAREDIQEGPWLQCSHYLLALEMARAGLGIALVPDFLAKRDIDSGTLIPFDRTRTPAGRTYNLCFKHSRSHEPAIKALVQWMKSELATGPALTADARRLG